MGWVKERIEAVGDLRVTKLEPVEGGTESLAFRVNGEWVFRFPKTVRAARSVEQEMELLEVLRPVLSVPVPQFSYVARSQGRIVFTGGPWYDGRPLTREAFAALTPAAQRSAVRQIAEVLQAVHAFPTTGTSLQEEAFKGGYNPAQRHFHDQLGEIISYHQHARLEQIYQAYEQDLAAHPAALTVIHADLKPEHLQIDPGTGELEAVLDWGDACLGDPDYDFALLHLHFGADFVRQVLAAVPGTDTERVLAKVPFFLLLRTLQDITIDVLSGEERYLEGNLAQLDELLEQYPLPPQGSASTWLL